MPSVNFTVKWPSGETNSFYSPSTVIYDFFKEGQQFSAADFLIKSEQGLNAASERVRARYGFACSSAMDSLSRIKRKVLDLKINQSDIVEIVSIVNVD